MNENENSIKLRKEFQSFSQSKFADSLRVKCERCYASNEDFKIEIHHKVPIGIGGDNDLENLISLCLSCHKEVHRNEGFYTNTSILSIKTIEEQVVLNLIKGVGVSVGYQFGVDEMEKVFYEIKRKYAKQYIKAFRGDSYKKTSQKDGICRMPVNENGQRYSSKTGNLLGREKKTLDNLPKDFEKTYRMLKAKNPIDGTLTTEQGALFLKISRVTLYRWIKLYESNLKK